MGRVTITTESPLVSRLSSESLISLQRLEVVFPVDIEKPLQTPPFPLSLMRSYRIPTTQKCKHLWPFHPLLLHQFFRSINPFYHHSNTAVSPCQPMSVLWIPSKGPAIYQQ